MSYIQDVGAMLRYQNLIEKEKTRNAAHPATKLSRRRFESEGGIAEPAPVGSVISVGMNKDPKKVKFQEKIDEALGKIVEPRRFFHIPKLLRDPLTGKVIPQRELKKMSTYNHYLEQKEGLVGNPHGAGGGMASGLPSIPKELEELLYTGTADEYEGRYAYLKAKRFLMKPSDRMRQPETSAKASSWELENFEKTRQWAPSQNTGTRGVMLRAFAEDAPTLSKSTDIINNIITMKTILGPERGRDHATLLRNSSFAATQ
mmetsp:Transcript_4610/g.11286  ORF Transcript_4610/g.11286 Transcript_4610/m.11286 type:complete len:259 (-) Transcript_4610:415-1191(-)|eukprot:g7786.t1